MRRIGIVLATGAVVASSFVLTVAPAHAATSVATEAQLRTAWGDSEETSISVTADITLTDCEAGDVDRNSTTAITLEGNGHTITQTCAGARVLYNSPTGDVTLDNVVITGGDHGSGGGGGLFTSGAIVITNSTITGNSANGGGAAFSFTSILVQNSTITGNTSSVDPTYGGGYGGGLEAPEITLVYATVVGNSGTQSANLQIDSTDTLVAFSSVVGSPLGGGPNCVFGQGQSTTSHGYNYADDTSCGFTNKAAGDNEGVADLGLGALADNGGDTPTMLPAAGSPLIDATPLAVCQADGADGIVTDQRDLPRPFGAGCDVGAVEVQVAAAPTTTAPAAAAPAVEAAPAFTG